MDIKQITLTPDPYEPLLLSQAHRVGDFVFVSGQAGVGGDGRIVAPGDFERQGRQALRRVVHLPVGDKEETGHLLAQ